MCNRILLLGLIMFSNAGITAEFGDALALHQNQNYGAALTVFEALAKSGSAPAQFMLGVMHDNGQGIPENDVEAVRWYQLAAEQGDSDAQFNLALMYENGEGVTQD